VRPWHSSFCREAESRRGLETTQGCLVSGVLIIARLRQMLTRFCSFGLPAVRVLKKASLWRNICGRNIHDDDQEQCGGNEMIGGYYNTPDFVGMVKLTRVKWAVGWKYAEKMKNAYYTLVRKLDSKRPLGTPSCTVQGWISLMLKYILGEDTESQGLNWIQLLQDRIILGSRLLWSKLWIFRFQNCGEFLDQIDSYQLLK